MQHIIQRCDLLCRIGSARLLSVTEGGICQPDFLRHIHGYLTVVERNLRHFVIAVVITIQVGLRNILKAVFIASEFQKIGFVVISDQSSHSFYLDLFIIQKQVLCTMFYIYRIYQS